MTGKDQKTNRVDGIQKELIKEHVHVCRGMNRNLQEHYGGRSCWSLVEHEMDKGQ